MTFLFFIFAQKFPLSYFSSNHFFKAWNRFSTPKNGGLGKKSLKIELQELFLKHFPFLPAFGPKMKNALKIGPVAQFSNFFT